VIRWWQAKTGITQPVLILLPVIVLALIGAFVFLCVSAFCWLSSLFDPVAGALLLTLFLAVVSMIAFATAVYLRDQTKMLALVARQANRAALLADPAILEMALAAGRKLGWHRTIPVAFLAVIAFQATSAIVARSWPRDHR
jgi:hypothetical protein